MKKGLVLFVAGVVAITTCIFLKSAKNTPIPHPSLLPAKSPVDAAVNRLKSHLPEAKQFAVRHALSTRYLFLLDMQLPSGRNRFFVYDALRDSVVLAGLVAHGSCNTRYLEAAKFSNEVGCGCTSSGKYKIGGPYQGHFGTAYKLHGLDSANSNAYRRNVVLHAYDGVPDVETDPYPICNSLGCPMVAHNFLNELGLLIQSSKKPILLWLYN